MAKLSDLKFEDYEICYGADLKEIESEGLVLRHKKSGARVCLISNKDKNKCFSIGFRTTPYDSTGVPHIIEHSVLCGSDKFPVKDPFVELAKSSLNTFLNAMTYPDKTVYPVASCNDQDIKNLMDVYMDAVLHPNIYKHDEIFRQEGWRYELDSKDGELTLNGVVYNEMKGAYSSVEDILETDTMAAMFPDTTYGISSGGDPDVIPTLTYEGFIDFHKRYYHPSNSYICLYGDFDMQERLRWLSDEYLSKYDYQPVDSEVTLQSSWGEPKVVEDEYPIADDDDSEDKFYYSYNAIIGDVLDAKKVAAWNVINYALFQTTGAPVKQALIDAGLGKDIMADFASYTRQTFLTVVAKEATKGQLDRFVDIIETELKKQVENGINKDTLLAGINRFDFSVREADSGTTPKGLVYILNMMSTWLHDDEKAFTNCFNREIYEELRKGIDEGYFEKLIAEELLESKAKVYHTLKPVKGLTLKKDNELKEKLAAYKASLSEEEIEQLIQDTAELKAYQESEDTPEAVATLPRLKVSDVDKSAFVPKNEELEISDSKVVFHDIATNGISYIRFMFDIKDLEESLWSYASLTMEVLAHNLNTKSHTYTEYSNEVDKISGGISAGLDTFSVMGNPDDYKTYAVVETKVFTENTGKILELIKELITASDFDDKKRVRDVLGEIVSARQSSLINGGHSTALGRAQSYHSPIAYYKQKISGIDYYEFVKDLYLNFDNKAQEAIEAMKLLAEKIFNPNRLLISFTSRADGLEEFKKLYPAFKKELENALDLKTDSSEKAGKITASEKESLNEGSKATGFTKNALNEAFKISGQVQYVASAGNYKRAGFDFTGALAVMKTILAYDYLWIQVRVKGGAYGCFYSYEAISGNCGFVSYRDPNLLATLEVYKGAADYIRSLELDEAGVEKYIIGTLSTTDQPRSPRGDGEYSMSCYISQVSNEQLQKERDEILGATLETIRATADILDCAANQGYICTVGSESKCTEAADVFKEIKKLQ
jgi:Zn-dependent M16 (insulinase) family peptidase